MKLRPANCWTSEDSSAVKTAASSAARRWWRTETFFQEKGQSTVSGQLTSALTFLSSFDGPGALAGAVEGYDYVPGPQSQPVGPESLVQREEALVPPRLHHPVQGSFVHRASRQNPLVHHAGPDHIHGVGRQRTCQPASETRTVVQKVKQDKLTWTKMHKNLFLE